MEAEPTGYTVIDIPQPSPSRPSFPPPPSALSPQTLDERDTAHKAKTLKDTPSTLGSFDLSHLRSILALITKCCTVHPDRITKRFLPLGNRTICSVTTCFFAFRFCVIIIPKSNSLNSRSFRWCERYWRHLLPTTAIQLGVK